MKRFCSMLSSLVGPKPLLSLGIGLQVSCGGQALDTRGSSQLAAGSGANSMAKIDTSAAKPSQDAVKVPSGDAINQIPVGDLGGLTHLVLKGLSHVAAYAGAEIVLTGTGFKPGMWLEWSVPSPNVQTPLPLKSVLVINTEGTTGRFQMPRGLNQGPVSGTIRTLESDKSSALDLDVLRLATPETTDSGNTVITVFYLGETSGDSEIPIFTGGPHQICSDQRFRQPTGEVVQGSKDCAPKLSDTDKSQGGGSGNYCQRDGDQNCLVGPGFRAAEVSRLVPQKIRSGHWVGGVAGQEPVCLKDGGRDCYMSLDNVYAAARLDQFGPQDIRQGVVIAGVTGTLTPPPPPPPPPFCGTGNPQITDNCLVGPGWVGVPRSLINAGDLRVGVVIAGVTGNVIPTPASCGADGQMECVVRNSWTAAAVSQLQPGNIRQGVSLGGVAGNVVPTPASCGADGQMECVVRNAWTAAAVSQLQPGNIRQGISLGGVAGNVIPTPASCGADGQQSCVVQGAFIALTGSVLTPGVIKAGVSIAGVVGSYPSAAFPLAGATSVPDLDNASFDAKIKSLADFEWFDSFGSRYVRQGDGDMIPENIKQGVTVFGSTGLLVGGLPCAADGGVGCVTGARYVAADTQGFGPWDLRHGTQAAGVIGQLVFYKNMAKVDLYDRFVGTAAIDGLDVYDTTDDHANIGQFPTENPSGWPQATGANWVREASTDNGSGGGTPANGICDGTEACLYSDRLTGMTWAKGDGVQRTFEGAITHCDGLIKGGFSDFRLPTQKELLQAYVNGIWSLKGDAQLNIMAFNWSSSTVSYAFDSGWLVYLNYGYSVATLKTSLAANICVRGI